MSFVKIWIHTVWATKNVEPVLIKPIRTKLFRHIRENAAEKGIYIDFLNGYVDHVHCTISLQPNQSIADVMFQIKGESSSWLNNQNLIEGKFRWQKEYYAVSVSESVIDKVRDYIRNQEAHHKNKSFQDEEKEMMTRFRFLKAFDED